MGMGMEWVWAKCEAAFKPDFFSGGLAVFFG